MYVFYILMSPVYIDCTVSHSRYSSIILELLHNIRKLQLNTITLSSSVTVVECSVCI